MLNIGKLSPGAAEYYIGEVATAAEDYYTGRGEARGRWVGSLREVLRLDGEVRPEHFRRVLRGEHPHTGVALVSSQGSAGRAVARRREHSPGEAEAVVDSARAAAFLGVSHQYVRRLLKAGAEYRKALDEAGPDEIVDEPRQYLLGVRVEGGGSTGGPAWRIPRVELERLASRRQPNKPRPGYDVTLRPPKSVSVLWALADDDVRAAVRQIHGEAVDEVIRYLETLAIRARVSEQGGRRLVATDGVIAAAFEHRTSRAGDPLLHTHVVVANMTRVDGPEGPIWRAIAGHGLFEHAKTAGHLYQAHLRHLLSIRLGVEWRTLRNGYADIVGVPTEVIETFSKRRGEIAEVLAESGNTSAGAAQVATLETRKPKQYDVDAETLYAQWRSEAAAAGFGEEDVNACTGRAEPSRLTYVQVHEAFDALAGPTGLTARASTFRRSEVIEALANRFTDACTASELEALADEFLVSDRVAVVETSAPATAPGAPAAAPARPEAAPVPRPRRGSPSTQTRYTTAQLAAIEEDVLAWAADSGTARTPALDGRVVETVLSERPELSEEQIEMIRDVCGHDGPLLPVAGRPGAGKTYATEAVVAAHVAAGVPVVGCAVSAAAADELERAAGFARSHAAATTVAGLLLDLDRWGGLAPQSVVIVDEASMLSTRDLHRLLHHVRHASGSLVLIGDPDQHGPVEVGGAFQRLCADRGELLTRLIDNNRQTDYDDRLAISDYRDGHISDALSRLDTAGRIVRSRTAGESFDAMVADWYADHLAGHADPMIAGPNSTRRALNDRARALLKANGELTGQSLVVAGHEYLVGDHVVARRNDRQLTSGSRSGFVKNGSTGVVTDMHPHAGEVTVAFDREGTIRVPRRYLAAGRLEHGYARTTYGVQGATHETSRYHPTDLSTFEEGYVAMTRGRTANRLYIVDGTITHTDDETHQASDPQRFDLDDIAEALTRRRAGTMAADAQSRLTAVHHLASTRSLGELAAARQPLESILAQAPPDARAALGRATAELEQLRARRRAWADDPATRPRRLAAIDRAISRTEQQLTTTVDRQREHDLWLDEHAEILDRYDLIARAELHRRAKITANPEHFLPKDEDGPTREPVHATQRQRRDRHTALVQRAMALDAAPSTANGDAMAGSQRAATELGAAVEP